MDKFKNLKKDSFLADLPVISLESDTNKLTERCKFNFSYFTSEQEHASDFSDLSELELLKLLNKLKHYSVEPLDYWTTQSIGSGKKRRMLLEFYGEFPSKSEFEFPKHIPHEVLWGRFRLESDDRLIGFVVPDEFHNTYHEKTGFQFDKNTFYVVFIDKNHKFYPSKK